MVKKASEIPNRLCIDTPTRSFSAQIVAKNIVVKAVFAVVFPFYDSCILPYIRVSRDVHSGINAVAKIAIDPTDIIKAFSMKSH